MDTLIIDAHSTATMEIKIGIKTIFRTGRPFRFVIETTGGTVIEGTVLPNMPLEIVPTADIKSFSIILDDNSVMPLHLVK